MPQLSLKEIPACLKILKRKVWFSSEYQWKQLKDFQFKRDGNRIDVLVNFDCEEEFWTYKVTIRNRARASLFLTGSVRKTFEITKYHSSFTLCA